MNYRSVVLFIAIASTLSLFINCSTMTAPDKGDLAPDFTLNDAEGNSVTLSSLKGKSVVLFFYPKDETAGCTAQACSFRDNYPALRRLGAEVFGISRDSTDSHRAFAEHHSLPYTLLTDKGGRVAELYGVRGPLGMIAGRVTFVIGPDGRILKRYDSLVFATSHVDVALKTLEAEAAKTTP